METDWTESAKSLIPNQKGCKMELIGISHGFLGTNFPSIVWVLHNHRSHDEIFCSGLLWHYLWLGWPLKRKEEDESRLVENTNNCINAVASTILTGRIFGHTFHKVASSIFSIGAFHLFLPVEEPGFSSWKKGKKGLCSAALLQTSLIWCMTYIVKAL